MTFIDSPPTRWRTIEAQHVDTESDKNGIARGWVIVYTKPDGTQAAHDADGLLVQADANDGSRTRVTRAMTDTRTGELIAADDVPGFLGLMHGVNWQSGYRIEVAQA